MNELFKTLVEYLLRKILKIDLLDLNLGALLIALANYAFQSV